MLRDDRAVKAFYDKMRAESEGQTTGRRRYSDKAQEQIQLRHILAIKCAPVDAPTISRHLSAAFNSKDGSSHCTRGVRLRFRPNSKFAVVVNARPLTELQSDQAKIQQQFIGEEGQVLPLSGFVSWSINDPIPELQSRPSTLLPSFTDSSGRHPCLAVAVDARDEPVILAFGFREDAQDLLAPMIIWFYDQLRKAGAEDKAAQYLSPMGLSLPRYYAWDDEKHAPVLKDNVDLEAATDSGLAELNDLTNPLAPQGNGVTFSPLEVAQGDVGTERSEAGKQHRKAQQSILKQGQAKYSPTGEVNPLATPGAQPIRAKLRAKDLAKLNESNLDSRQRKKVLRYLGQLARLNEKKDADLLRDGDAKDLRWNLKAALVPDIFEYRRDEMVAAIQRMKEVLEFGRDQSDDEMTTVSDVSDMTTASSVVSEGSEASALTDADDSDVVMIEGDEANDDPDDSKPKARPENPNDAVTTKANPEEEDVVEEMGESQERGNEKDFAQAED